MGAFRFRDVVFQLKPVLIIADHASIASAPCKCPLHGHGGVRVLRNLIISRADILEARLVHGGRAQDLRIANLHAVLVVRHVICLALECELRHTAVGLHLAIEHVAHGERVLIAKLEIEARAHELDALSRLKTLPNHEAFLPSEPPALPFAKVV